MSRWEAPLPSIGTSTVPCELLQEALDHSGIHRDAELFLQSGYTRNFFVIDKFYIDDDGDLIIVIK